MEHETIIRLSIFLGLFLVLSLFELWMPKRGTPQRKTRRWITNWGISLVNTVMLSMMAVALPLLAVGAAIDAQSHDWGMFNWIELPFALELIFTVLIFDFAIWGQHLLSHKIPVLWRIHRMHHADVELDVSTAIRFHPIEIGLSMLLKIGLVYLLGAHAIAIIVFEVLLNATALFNHANIHISKRIDAWIRFVLVTPDMHRIHHSIKRVEHDSNYGFSLSIWDRIFNTYRPNPNDSHENMQIGLQWQDERPSQILWSLKLPFKNK